MQAAQGAFAANDNGNLLNSNTLSNTWDAANRLTQIVNRYNGANDRVGQTVGLSTTHFALDIAAGLPEVIYTSNDEVFLHLPGIIVAEDSSGDPRYLLSDGLGSIRQAVDEIGAVTAYYEFDPYGNPLNNNGGEPYGYTGEWYEGYTELMHLRARWYSSETGTFLSRDSIESEPPYQYVQGNTVNFVDPTGKQGCPTVIPECNDPWLPLKELWEYAISTNPAPPDPEYPLNPQVPFLLEKANGYVEGRVSVFAAFGCVWTIVGEEIVYDFQSRQRQKFTYTSAVGQDGVYTPVAGLAPAIWGGSEVAYGGFLWCFTDNGIVGDYSEYFVGTSLGVNASIFSKLGFNAGPAVGLGTVYWQWWQTIWSCN